jgi:hypothetical protein
MSKARPKIDQIKGMFDEISPPKPKKKEKETEKETQPKRFTSFRLNATARKQLDILAIEEDETLQSLMCQAVNDLFEKYGKPQIA